VGNPAKTVLTLTFDNTGAHPWLGVATQCGFAEISSRWRIYLMEGSRDKTDDLVTTDDGVSRTVSLTGAGMAGVRSHYGPI